MVMIMRMLFVGSMYGGEVVNYNIAYQRRSESVRPWNGLILLTLLNFIDFTVHEPHICTLFI